ncbi:MAG: 2-deoxy-D-gluconate 3-dehydrogenase [Polyangiales bacterium]|jgi:2-deoxy-D-gluconate 3-dehydrogenase
MNTLAGFSLQGQRALVTGGSRGIGGAIADGLAAAGAEMNIVARSSGPCEAKAKALGGRAFPCDVTQHDAFKLAMDAAGGDPGLDIFVACAGASHSGSASSLAMSDLQRMFEIHVKAAIYGAQLAAEQMRKAGKGGSILLVTSVWGLGGQPGTLAYGTAKAALAHAVRVLAIEWARDNIRVNGLAPGFVDTDMTADVGDVVRGKLLARVPMRRAAKPEEMAGPALFLCSPAASYVTGQILAADGGERAR